MKTPLIKGLAVVAIFFQLLCNNFSYLSSVTNHVTPHGDSQEDQPVAHEYNHTKICLTGSNITGERVASSLSTSPFNSSTALTQTIDNGITVSNCDASREPYLPPLPPNAWPGRDFSAVLLM